MLVRSLAMLLAAAFAANADPLPSNLTAENLPPISEQLRTEASRYLNFRSAGFRGWLPGKREMLISTRFGDTAQIHLVATPGGARRQLTFLGEPVSSALVQPKLGRAFVFGQDVGGSESYQLYRYDFADGRITLLTDGKSRNTGPKWSRDGKKVAYATTRRNGRDNDIHLLDPFQPDSDKEVLRVNGGGWSVASWSHDHAKLVLHEFISANESRLHLLDLATGQSELLTPDAPEKVAWGDATFAPDDASLLALTDKGSEFSRLVRLDLNTKAVTPLTQDIPWDVEDLALSPNGERVAIVSNEDGISVLRILDAHTGTLMSKPKLPLGVLGNIAWRSDSRELGFSLNSAASPTDAWSLDLPTGKLFRWTSSETGGLDAQKFSAPELVRIESFDGQKMSGFLYRPDPKRWPGKRPCLVDIHGGPEGQSQPVFLGRYNYFLDELGLAIFFPNVRGSAGYGKTFLALDNGFKREDTVKDIGAFLDKLSKDDRLDPARFAVTGGSYGGYMSLASMIRYGERLRCGIDIVGVADFLTFLANTSEYRRDLRRVEYGDERDAAMHDFLARISPTARAGEIRQPLFVVQGKNDPRVSVKVARQVVEAVRQAGGTVAYLEAADEGHGFAKKSNADLLFLAEIAFLRAHLLN